MNWNQIIVTFLTACVPALIAYLTSHFQTKAKFKELKIQHEHEIELIKLQQANKQDDLQNQLMFDALAQINLAETMKEPVQQMMASQLKQAFEQQRKN
ncbi:TPA: hypothetical protein ACJS0P_001275 [Streptococcus agalactiae]